MKTPNWLSLIQDKLEGWWIYAIRMLPNFIVALLVLVVFFFVAKLIRNLSYRFILRVSKSISVSALLSGVIYTFVMISGIMTALDILELDKPVSSLLAGVGIIGLALGFAFQDLTANFISGAFIALKRPFDVGHTVETNGFTGTVEEIQLRSTTLRTSAGLHVIIPNKDIFQKPIINYSRSEARKVEIEFILPNTVDVLFAEKCIRETMQNLERTYLIENVQVYYLSIETPNMRLQVAFWTSQIEPLAYVQIKHQAITRIYQTFSEKGIYNTLIPPREKQA